MGTLVPNPVKVPLVELTRFPGNVVAAERWKLRWDEAQLEAVKRKNSGIQQIARGGEQKRWKKIAVTLTAILATVLSVRAIRELRCW